MANLIDVWLRRHAFLESYERAAAALDVFTTGPRKPEVLAVPC